MIDLTQPPMNWRFIDEDEKTCVYTGEFTPLEEAHKIAAEEAQPYVDHTLERILHWLEHDFYDEWHACSHGPTGVPVCADTFIEIRIRKILSKERPLP